MKRLTRTVLVCFAIAVLLSSQYAAAEEGLVCLQKSRLGTCLLWATAPSPQPDPQPAGPGSNSGTSRPCFANGNEVPCTSSYGWWSHSKGCYIRVADPQPPHTDTMWHNRTNGVVAECVSPGGTVRFEFWMENAEPVPPPDPAVLAEQAVATMNMTAIDIGSYPHTTQRSPDSIGIIGWNVWMWVSDASAETFGPITKSASAGGYTVTATAQVTEVVWDMGNGDTVTCGKGTKYTGMGTSDIKSPTCGYRYTDDGDYQISATTHWQVNWSGIGQSGTIEMDLVTPAEQLTVAEIQVVNVPVEQG